MEFLQKFRQTDHWPPGSQPLGGGAPATGLRVLVRLGSLRGTNSKQDGV